MERLKYYYGAGVAIIATISGLTALSDQKELWNPLFCTLFSVFTLAMGIPRLRARPNDDLQARTCVANYVVAVFHLASAVTLSWLAFRNENKWEAPVNTVQSVWYRTTSNDCSPSDPCYLDFITRRLDTNIPVAALAALFGVVSGAGHGLVLILDDADLESFCIGVYSGRNRFRWADYAISSSIMIVVIATVTGVSEVYVLSTVALLQSFLMVISAVAEDEFSRFSRESFERGAFLFGVSFFVYLFGVWGPIIGQFYDRSAPAASTVLIDTNTYATQIDEPPSWVNIIVWGLFAVFTSFGIVMAIYNLIFQSKTQRKYAQQELAYMSLSLIAKTLLHWTLYFGIASRSNTVFNSANEVQASDQKDNTSQRVGIAAGVVSFIGIGIYIGLRRYLLYAVKDIQTTNDNRLKENI